MSRALLSNSCTALVAGTLGCVTATRTARDRARADLTRTIKATARTQLAEVGADGLSLRAVARELGMVSSALYRYFPSRDSLLTALIVDAYDALGAAAEKAAAKESVAIQRWRAVCHAIRDWARAHPHEYALIYGSPVPGYKAPQDTVAPASRAAIALVDAVKAGWGAGVIRPVDSEPVLSDLLRDQVRRLGDDLAPGLPEAVLARTLVAWTQLFGMVGFELFGQLVGSADPADEFFAYAVEQMADLVGLS